MTFQDRLSARIRTAGSHLCVGLDPRAESISGNVFDFLRRVIDETAEEAAAYKPNIAYFEALGCDGYAMLEKTIAHAAPVAPVILDAKRGDIAETQACYARAYFDNWNVDAVTLNPYLGLDSCEPFLGYPDKGVYILAVTSNAGASHIQLKELKQPPGRYVFEEAVEMTRAARAGGTGIGLVLGLTQITDDILNRIPDVPLLIPGLGAQGGDLNRIAAGSRAAPIVVNVSRALLYPSGDSGFRVGAKSFKDKINAAFHG